MKDVFGSCHPGVILLFLSSAILCSMMTFQPGCVIISFLIGSLYSIRLGGLKRWLAGIRLLSVLFLVVALGNPLLNHRGATALFHLWGAPITRESIIFGLCMGGMMVSVFVWFQCYQRLMPSDRFLFLFGGVAPTSALIVSMILKFIPVTSQRYHSIQMAQAGMGTADMKADRKAKIRNGVKMTGILMSWSMEASIDTANSMKARGYGAGKRTHFSRYRVTPLDIWSFAVLGCLFAANLAALFLLFIRFRFFPFVTAGWLHMPAIGLYILYAVMLSYPLLLEGKERLRWHYR